MKTADIQVTYLNHMGDDLTVVNAARVSFDKESVWESDSDGWLEGVLKESDAKLISYLADHKHFSPFNHAFLSFRVKAPIFVARQLVKHKFMPWNEISRRYVNSEPEFYMPNEYRLKADNVKQGSSEETTENFINPWNFEDCKINDVHIQHMDASLDMYESLLRSGICAEEARMVLPQNVMTEWIWSGSLGAFLDMLVLRLDPHTQLESRIVAQQIAERVKALFPISFESRIK